MGIGENDKVLIILYIIFILYIIIILLIFIIIFFYIKELREDHFGLNDPTMAPSKTLLAMVIECFDDLML